MRYGVFTDMAREDVIAHLESEGFAVRTFDNESTDTLREAAHLNEELPIYQVADTAEVT